MATQERQYWSIQTEERVDDNMNFVIKLFDSYIEVNDSSYKNIRC